MRASHFIRNYMRGFLMIVKKKETEINIDELLEELEESTDEAWQWLLDDKPIPWGPLEYDDDEDDPTTDDGDPTTDDDGDVDAIDNNESA